MPQCKENRPSILNPPCAKHLGLGFVLFCFLITPPHNLNFLQFLFQYQNTKLLLHKVPMKRPTHQDSHRFCLITLPGNIKAMPVRANILFFLSVQHRSAQGTNQFHFTSLHMISYPILTCSSNAFPFTYHKEVFLCGE